MTISRSIRWLPASTGAAVLLTAGPLAWMSRDFGWFLFALFDYVPILLLLCACLLIWAIFERRSERRLVVLITMATIIALPPGLVFADRHLHERVAFLFWYPVHQKLVGEFAAKDGIIAAWDRWGMAGSENDSYLVSDTSDAISTMDAASSWARNNHTDCPIVDAKRMMRGLYIITTYNCPLE
jgi:hypothetical protein